MTRRETEISVSDESSTDAVSESPITPWEPPNDISGLRFAPSQNLDQESLQTIIESYVRYYASGAGHTARAKRYDLEHFLLFIAGSPSRASLVRVSDWTLQKTQDFVDNRLNLGEAPATVARRLATVKHFGRTLAERVPGFINPAREVKSPLLQTTRPHGLTSEEIALLLEIARTDCLDINRSFNSVRNRFLLELLLATGLRADEVRLLTISQLSSDLSWLKNVKTKGRKFRNVYLNSEIRALAQDYLIKRETALLHFCPQFSTLTEAAKSRFPVLVSLYRAVVEQPASFGMSSKTIWRVIASFGSRAHALAPTAGSRLHPHVLRHTFAHGLLDSSKDIRLVAQALGHSDVRTTMRYTERTEEEIALAIEKKLADS